MNNSRLDALPNICKLFLPLFCFTIYTGSSRVLKKILNSNSYFEFLKVKKLKSRNLHLVCKLYHAWKCSSLIHRSTFKTTYIQYWFQENCFNVITSEQSNSYIKELKYRINKSTLNKKLETKVLNLYRNGITWIWL